MECTFRVVILYLTFNFDELFLFGIYDVETLHSASHSIGFMGTGFMDCTCSDGGENSHSSGKACACAIFYINVTKTEYFHTKSVY